jgi:hypothetical protein
MGGGEPIDRINRRKITPKKLFYEDKTVPKYETGIEGYEL